MIDFRERKMVFKIRITFSKYELRFQSSNNVFKVRITFSKFELRFLVKMSYSLGLPKFIFSMNLVL